MNPKIKCSGDFCYIDDNVEKKVINVIYLYLETGGPYMELKLVDIVKKHTIYSVN